MNQMTNDGSNGSSGFAAGALTRRRFGKIVLGLGALGLIESQSVVRAIETNRRRLSWLAYRTAEREGVWELTDIEGRVPADLDGTLYRVAPGQTENHGVTLRHFFDGDTYLSGFTFREGRVDFRTRFLDLPERLKELEAGRMLYSEFGTLAPPSPAGKAVPGIKSKNQPNVNVVAWDGRLLGLSEGGHPTAIDPGDLSYQERWDFHGTLPRSVPFTAHPKFDEETGVGYGYGVSQGIRMSLNVYRMETDGRLTQLHSVPQTGYCMVHDMMLTKKHLVFVIPPVQFDLPTLFAGKLPVAEAVRYFENEPMRILILRRDGTGEPVTINQPAGMVFHHGNAFEKEGKLVIDSMLSEGDSALTLLNSWAEDTLPEVSPPTLTRIVFDLASARAESRTGISVDQEFPRFDTRRSGEDARYLYTGESTITDDPFVSTRIVKHDLHRGESKPVGEEQGRAYGEAVFVPREGSRQEDDGWLLAQGYDAGRDENFLEIRDAASLELAARAWTTTHFPLGFHGNFVPNTYIST